MTINCSGKKCSFVYSVFVLIAMVAAIWVIWSGRGSLFDNEKTESNLSKLSGQLVDIGNDYGKVIKITHGAIETDSWSVNKRSVVRDMNIEIKGKSPGDMLNFTLALGDVVTYSDPYNAHKTVMEISNPVNVYSNGSLIKSIIFSEPLLYSYQQPQLDSSGAFQHNITLPKTISLTSADAAVQADTGSGMSISFPANPTIEIISTEKHLSSIFYDLSGLTVVSDGQKTFSLGTLRSQFNEEDGDDEGKRAGKYNFVADDVVFYKEEASTRPYSFNINTSMVFDAVTKGAEEPQSSSDILKSNFYNDISPSQNREVTLNNVTMSNPDFLMRATGIFANVVGDPLPSGEVSLDIDNVQAFLSSELVAMQGRDLVAGAITKIVGQSLDGQQQVSFTLKREKNGVFYVGKTTFEELVASVLSGSMIGSPSNSGRLPENQLPMRAPVTNDEGKNNDAGTIESPAPKP